MRANLEDARAYRLRHFGTKRPGVATTLTGTFVVPNDGPEIYMFDAGSSTKTVKLPALTEEVSLLLANVGAANNLDIYNSLNVLQTSIQPGGLKYFFATLSRWVWLSGNIAGGEQWITEELRVVTAAGAQVISSVEPGLVLNKSIASATPVTLPLASVRFGRPVRIVDWAGTTNAANPLTVTPSGADKINNQANYISETIGFGGLILFPNTALGGYTVGA